MYSNGKPMFASYNELSEMTHTDSLLWNYNTGDTIFRGAALADIDGNAQRFENLIKPKNVLFHS